MKTLMLGLRRSLPTTLELVRRCVLAALGDGLTSGETGAVAAASLSSDRSMVMGSAGAAASVDCPSGSSRSMRCTVGGMEALGDDRSMRLSGAASLGSESRRISSSGSDVRQCECDAIDRSASSSHHVECRGVLRTWGADEPRLDLLCMSARLRDVPHRIKHNLLQLQQLVFARQVLYFPLQHLAGRSQRLGVPCGSVGSKQPTGRSNAVT